MTRLVDRLGDAWGAFYRDHPDLVNSVVVGALFVVVGFLAARMFMS